jgi:hypothetical protein
VWCQVLPKGVEGILTRARTIVDHGANVEIQHVVLVSRCTEIADGRLRVFKYLSRFKTNIIAF